MMRKVFQFVVIFALAFATRFTHAQTDAFQNWCQDGGVRVLTSGLPSSTMVQASYPQCKVDVYLTGTLTRATIFKDKLGTPLTNPFTAFQDGYWLFFAADGQGYDVVMSLGTPNAFPSPKTLTDLIIGPGSGGSTVVQVNGTPIITQSPVNFVNANGVTFTNPSAGVINAAVAGAGCGPLSGDTDSTDCGNNNFVGTPVTQGQTVIQAYGFTNANSSPFLSEGVAIGNNNLVSDVGTSLSNSLAAAVGIGLTNVNNINTGGSIVGIGQDTANGIFPSGSTNVFEVVAIGDGDASKIGSTVDDVIALGDGTANTIPATSVDIIAIGDGADKQCGTFTGCGSLPNPAVVNDVIAIGDVAASFNQGSNIVAIGAQAMGSNALGAGAGFYNSGDFNVAIGSNALAANTTGALNTALGGYAGADGYVDFPRVYGNSNHTGSHNTWIGYDSGPHVTTQLSNTIALGYQAFNTQSNQTVIGNSSITQLIVFGTGDGCLSSTSGVITGSGSVCGSGGGGGSNVTVNGGSTLTTANFNSATPAAGANNINVTWQVSAPSVSAEVPYATSGAFGVVKPDNSTITISGGVISAVGGGGPTIQTNGTPNTSQSLLNFVNPGNFNGLTFTFSNPSGGIETFAVGGTLGNAGLTNSSMTINGTSCTLGGSCTVSGGGTVSSVANSDGTLTISPTTGAVVASLALGHANTWSAVQTLSGLTLSGITGSTQCLQVNTSGVVSGTGSVCGSGGSTAWSALTNPSTNLALTMGSNTTTFTFGATTGSADLFKWTDTASNTGTGIIGHFTTAASSTEIPWQADVNGIGWRVATDGSLRGVGSSSSHGMVIPEGSPLSGVALSDVVAADSTTHRILENPNNTGAVILSGTAAARTSGDCVAWAANGIDLVDAGGACGISGGGSAFSAITTGANTTATMTLGTGSSLATTGTGTNQATIVASEESVSFSTTPTFSTSARESTITLTASITSFTLASGIAGQEKTLTFCENSTGGFDVTPPANVHGFMTLSGGTETASKCNSQHFTYNSIQTAWIADSSGVLNQ